MICVSFRLFGCNRIYLVSPCHQSLVFRDIKFATSYQLGLTYLIIIIRLPTVKNIQNFLAFNNRKGMYIDEIRKHDRPEPRHTAKQMSLWVADSLNVNLFKKLGPLEVESSSINDLNEYCELNISSLII